MSRINKDGRSYSGAGVLIVEDYYKKDGTIEPCIVLVRNKASGEYTEFGGSYERKHGSLEKTAYAELREESRNLFNIDTGYLNKYVDINAGADTFYRAYIIKLNGISRKYYLYNMKQIDLLYKRGVKISRVWRETDDLVHVPISNINFEKLGIRGKVILRDIDNRVISIRGRIKKVLRDGQTIISDIIHEKSIGKRKDMIRNTSIDWTNGTYSFVIR